MISNKISLNWLNDIHIILNNKTVKQSHFFKNFVSIKQINCVTFVVVASITYLVFYIALCKSVFRHSTIFFILPPSPSHFTYRITGNDLSTWELALWFGLNWRNILPVFDPNTCAKNITIMSKMQNWSTVLSQEYRCRNQENMKMWRTHMTNVNTSCSKVHSVKKFLDINDQRCIHLIFWNLLKKCTHRIIPYYYWYYY